jgi:predicted enzyme related to lactoylglutathione lyase
MANAASMHLRSIVFDRPDPTALASFYAALLDAEADTSDPSWCEVHTADTAIKLAFQKVESYVPPVWPDGVPQQLHLDLSVTDVQAASLRAVSLGATVLSGPMEEPGCTWVVHADPAGHPFCLCRKN